MRGGREAPYLLGFSAVISHTASRPSGALVSSRALGDRVAVPLHLVGDRGRRSPYGLRNLAAGGALLEHLLYLVPVMPREADVRPSAIVLLPAGYSDLLLFPGPLSGPQEREALTLIASRIAEFSSRFAQLANLGIHNRLHSLVYIQLYLRNIVVYFLNIHRIKRRMKAILVSSTDY